MKNMSETSYSNLLLSSHEIISILEKNMCKQIEKKRRVNLQARVIYKLRLNTGNTKYSQNVTCICKNIISIKHNYQNVLLPQSYFRKMDMTLMHATM